MNRMRILIDGLSARRGGGVTYLRHILPALVSQAPNNQYSIILSSVYQHNLISNMPSEVKVIEVELPPKLLSRFWFLYFRLPGFIGELQADIFFAPAESFYLQVPTKIVMAARNLSIYAPLDSFGSQKLEAFRYRLSRQPFAWLSLRTADRIVVVSQSFGKQLERRMRIDPQKIRIVYHGVSPDFQRKRTSSNRLPLDRPYYLAVSTVSPHKNYETLLKAYAHLPRDAPDLLIAGDTSHVTTYRTLRSIVDQEQLFDRVHFIGNVPYHELPALYQGAVALVFPSRLETFGHPLIEAMTAGTPVIASDLPVCREICQDGALFFPADDIDKLSSHMIKIVQESNLRGQLIQRGLDRTVAFSWGKSARELVAVFKELCC